MVAAPSITTTVQVTRMTWRDYCQLDLDQHQLSYCLHLHHNHQHCLQNHHHNCCLIYQCLPLSHVNFDTYGKKVFWIAWKYEYEILWVKETPNNYRVVIFYVFFTVYWRILSLSKPVKSYWSVVASIIHWLVSVILLRLWLCMLYIINSIDLSIFYFNFIISNNYRESQKSWL